MLELFGNLRALLGREIRVVVNLRDERMSEQVDAALIARTGVVGALDAELSQFRAYPH